MSTKTPRDRPSSHRGSVPERAVHEIGYGKPPRAHQFKPSQSGNPKGRPKGAKNEATILRDLLNRKITIREGGKARKITVFEAILVGFTNDALKGNTKSAAFILNRNAGAQMGEPSLNDDISQDDRAVLDAFVRQFEAQHKQKKKKS